MAEKLRDNPGGDNSVHEATSRSEAVKAALLYVPLTDPTSGYHSLAYLNGYAHAQGRVKADIIDANIEAFHATLRPEVAERLVSHHAKVRSRFLDAGSDATSWAGSSEAILRATPIDVADVRSAVKFMRSGDGFFDYPTYRRQARIINGWMNLISVSGIPGAFRDGFRLALGARAHPHKIDELLDPEFTRALCSPFEEYIGDDLIPRLCEYDVVGINITYERQLPFAVEIARQLKARISSSGRAGPLVIFGGTEVSDVWKYLKRQEDLFRVLDAADAAVVGEGESAWVEILDRVRDFDNLRHPNVKVRGQISGAGRSLPLYEDVSVMSIPDYGGLPYDLYLSPRKFAYYSPTRGCYWNKCTFCDYGLNFDSPTSPWRQNPVERILGDLQEMAKEFEYVYLSVDVLAPAMMMRLSEALVERDIRIRWGAEIRLEKYWTRERCEILAKSGCVMVSVGFESANERILKLINKGTKTSQVESIIKNLHEAGVGVEMMGFTGFPSETKQEAFESIEFLERNRTYWSFGGLGEFVLTTGSIVAKEPERFGIRNPRFDEGVDLERVLHYEETATIASDRTEIAEASAALRTWDLDRPWVGGVDTPHTFFYAERFGHEVLAAVSKRESPQLDACWRTFGTMATLSEPIAELVGERPGRVWVRPDGAILRLPDLVLDVLCECDGVRTFELAAALCGLTEAPLAAEVLAFLLDEGVVYEDRSSVRK